MKQERKIKRKIKFEIFEHGYHTMTQESGLYETDLDGNPTDDIFKNCINTVVAKQTILSTNKGKEYLRGAFCGNNAEFVIIKVNKRNIQKFIVMRSEYKLICRRKFKV
tara:strand:- start:3788 stop:4111 length:324 start_codon:yes stop_codon:yes gene_type:complete